MLIGEIGKFCTVNLRQIKVVTSCGEYKFIAPFEGQAMKLQIALASAAMLLSGLTDWAAAQQAAQPSEEVTIFAPYLIQKIVTGPTGAPAMMVTNSRNVSYHDLDLKTDADVATLEGRVRQAAQDICQELDQRYSPQIYVRISKHCAIDAANVGLTQLKALVAAIRGSYILGVEAPPPSL
jgi:UrcA family protein